MNKEGSEGNKRYVVVEDGRSNSGLGWVKINDVRSENMGKESECIGKYWVKGRNNGVYSIGWGSKKEELLGGNRVGNEGFNGWKGV